LRRISGVSRFGVHGAGVVTALTVQDAGKCTGCPAFPNVVLAHSRALRDLRPDAVKLGCSRRTTSPAASSSVCASSMATRRAARAGDRPVLAASDGTPLLERRAWGVLRI
jgi:hydroxymethylpyrimidine/phosphomethylpyrimidine kinase